MMKQFVRLKEDPTSIGVLVVQGHQISEVRFKNEPWSHFAYYANRRLEVIEGEQLPVATDLPSKVEQIDYGSHRIKILCERNPRSPGTGAFRKWEHMREYIEAHPRASIKQVADNTTYRVCDFRWDLEHNNVGYES